MAYIPFRERLWCSVSEAQQFLGNGRTNVFEKIRNGEIVSRREGRRRLIHVPSLIARYSLDGLETKLASTSDEQKQLDSAKPSSEFHQSSGDCHTANVRRRKRADVLRKADLTRRR